MLVLYSAFSAITRNGSVISPSEIVRPAMQFWSIKRPAADSWQIVHKIVKGIESKMNAIEWMSA